MKLLKGIPKLKARRESISRDRLIELLPIDKRFRVDQLNIDINPHSFKDRMVEFPFIEIDVRKNGNIYYLLTKENYKKLINWLHSKEKPERAPKQKIISHKLSIADICQNIAEGWHKNNVLPGA